jgi:hypothetical protein
MEPEYIFGLLGHILAIYSSSDNIFEFHLTRVILCETCLELTKEGITRWFHLAPSPSSLQFSVFVSTLKRFVETKNDT